MDYQITHFNEEIMYNIMSKIFLHHMLFRKLFIIVANLLNNSKLSSDHSYVINISFSAIIQDRRLILLVKIVFNVCTYILRLIINSFGTIRHNIPWLFKNTPVNRTTQSHTNMFYKFFWGKISGQNLSFLI